MAELVAAHSLDELTVEEDGLRVTVKGVTDIPAPPVGVVLHPHLLTDAAQPIGTHLPAASHSSAARVPPPSGSAGAETGGLRITPPPRLPGLPVQSGTSPTGQVVSLVALESPMVGVYYRSPTPDDPPFVNVGDTIKVGQTVGLIEAMKVYSELPSDVSGRVVRLAAENGALVQQGEPLLYVEPV